MKLLEKNKLLIIKNKLRKKNYAFNMQELKIINKLLKYISS